MEQLGHYVSLIWRRTGKGKDYPQISNNDPAAPCSAPVALSGHDFVHQGDEQSAFEVGFADKNKPLFIQHRRLPDKFAPVMLRNSATQTESIAVATTKPPRTQSRQTSTAERSETPSQNLHRQFAEPRPSTEHHSLLQRSGPLYELSVPLERLSAWKSFIEQHGKLLEKRIRADEIRRSTRDTRQSFQTHARQILAVIRASELQELLQEYQLLEESFDKLEEAERQVEEVEDNIVQAEAAISRTLPVVPSSDQDRTLEMLEYEGLFLRPSSSPSTIPQQDVSLSDEELSFEHSQFLSKLGKVDLIEDKLFELRKDKDIFRAQNEAELDSQSLAFLRNYEAENERLSKALDDARYQLELVRDTLQPPPLPVSDDEGGYSDS